MPINVQRSTTHKNAGTIQQQQKTERTHTDTRKRKCFS